MTRLQERKCFLTQNHVSVGDKPADNSSHNACPHVILIQNRCATYRKYKHCNSNESKLWVVCALYHLVFVTFVFVHGCLCVLVPAQWWGSQYKDWMEQSRDLGLPSYWGVSYWERRQSSCSSKFSESTLSVSAHSHFSWSISHTRILIELF